MANSIDDYMMYNGNEGIYTFTYKNDRKEDCKVCSSLIPMNPYPIEKELKLKDFITKVTTSKLFKKRINAKVENFSVLSSLTLYSDISEKIKKKFQKNLEKSMGDLVDDGDEIIFQSEDWKKKISVIVDFGEDEDESDDIDEEMED